MAVGWRFRKNKDFVLAYEPDKETAKEMAVKHFGGEPDGPPIEIPQSVVDFFGMERGQYATARVLNRVET